VVSGQLQAYFSDIYRKRESHVFRHIWL